jgi:hypothetical protein
MNFKNNFKLDKQNHKISLANTKKYKYYRIIKTKK